MFRTLKSGTSSKIWSYTIHYPRFSVSHFQRSFLTRTPGCRLSWFQTGRSALRRCPAPACRCSPHFPDTCLTLSRRSQRSGHTDTEQLWPSPPQTRCDSSCSHPDLLAPPQTPSSAGHGPQSYDLETKIQQNWMKLFIWGQLKTNSSEKTDHLIII